MKNEIENYTLTEAMEYLKSELENLDEVLADALNQSHFDISLTFSLSRGLTWTYNAYTNVTNFSNGTCEWAAHFYDLSYLNECEFDRDMDTYAQDMIKVGELGEAIHYLYRALEAEFDTEAEEM